MTSSKQLEEIIDCLRRIRDTAWTGSRIDGERFGEIETLAEHVLKELGVNDRPYPNPRPYGWRNHGR